MTAVASHRVSIAPAAVGWLEAGWLTLVVVTPLLFHSDSIGGFEPVKVATVRAIAACMVAAWTIGALLGARVPSPGRPRLAPLSLAALLLGLATMTSVAFSIAPATSWWGSIERGQGGLTTLAYLAVFAIVAAYLRTGAQWRRLTGAFLLTSVPVSLYAIAQRMGLDPVVWVDPQQERFTSTLGNPIFFAGYLLFPMFATLDAALAAGDAADRGMGRLERVRAGAPWLLLLSLQSVAFLLSESRGPLVGLLVGALVFAILRGSSRLLPAGLVLAAIVLLIAMALSPGLRRRAEDLGWLGRFTSTFVPGTATGQVRLVAWEGVASLLASPEPVNVPGRGPDTRHAWRPLFGYGPETLAMVFPRAALAKLSRIEPGRNLDRAHNDTLEVLATAGLAGLATQLWVFGEVLLTGAAALGLVAGSTRGGASGRRLLAGWMLGGAAIGAFLPFALTGSAVYWGPGLAGGMLAGFFLRTGLYAIRDRLSGTRRLEASSSPAAWLLAALVAHIVEIQFGIAVTATKLHFWILAGALFAVANAGTRSPPLRERAVPELAPHPRNGEALPWAIVLAVIASSLAVGLGPFTLMAAGFSRPGEMPAARSASALTMIALLLLTGAAASLLVGRRLGGGTLKILGAGLAVGMAVPILFETPRSAVVLLDAETAPALARHAGHAWLAWIVLVVALWGGLGLALARRAVDRPPPSARRRSWVEVAAAVAIAVALVAAIQRIAVRPIAASIDARYAEVSLAHDSPRWAQTLARRAVEQEPSEPYYRGVLARAIAAGD